jgi:hypothetical protein
MDNARRQGMFSQNRIKFRLLNKSISSFPAVAGTTLQAHFASLKNCNDKLAPMRGVIQKERTQMKFYTILVLCFFAFSAVASKKAITDEGDVVVLNDDGTWIYENEKAENEIKLDMNPLTFSKNSDSKFMLKSGKTNNAFWINPKKWTFKKNDNEHEAAEYTLDVKGSDLYGMVISEQLEIKLETLVELAFDNAKSAAPDMKVVKKEYRMVNNQKVIYMEMKGTIQSMKITYLGYYFSDPSGSTQYLTYTGTNLVKKYRKDIDDFLNGFASQL